jgi:hypothetical protein
MMQSVKQGDCFLYCLAGVFRWIGILEVLSAPFEDIENL